MTSKRKFFKNEGIECDLQIGSFVKRVSNKRSGDLAKVLIDESLDKKFGKFIKDTKASSLAFASRNPREEKFGIIIFNLPEERIAYKVIYRPSLSLFDSDQQLKVFSSTEEGKWHVVSHPSSEIIKLADLELEWLTRNRQSNYYQR